MKTTSSTSRGLMMAPSAHPMKKVAVIGAGLSGLVTMKELLGENHSVVCFEHEDDIGGTFYNKHDKYGVYNDLHLTISNYFMAFSSLPPDEPKRRYWTAEEYLQYLRQFADRYALRSYIRFNTDVLKVTPVDRETWRVTVQKNGTVTDEYVDAVAICSGRFRQPRLPRFEKMDTFRGTIHHSYKYKSANDFVGKTVVCVGLGETGSDVVHQIAKTARKAHLVINRPKHIIPRIIFGDTNDARTTRASHYSYLVSQSACEALIKKMVFDTAMKRARKTDVFSTWKYLIEYGFHGEFSNKNDGFFQDIEHGRLQLHLFGIDHFEPDGVVLKDGTHVPCTDVMLSTGYSTQFDIIDHPAAEEVASSVRSNLLHMIHPDLRESMAWIGFVRPDVGGVPAVSELQARYFAKLLSKKKLLPEREALMTEIAELRRKEEFHFSLEPTTGENVKYYHIMNQLAEKIGARPKWYHVLTDPRLALYFYHGSMVASQFRLVGPDSNRAQATEFIKRMGLIKAPAKHQAFVVAVTTALAVAAPFIRKAITLLGLAEHNPYRRNRYRTVQDILAKQWLRPRSDVAQNATLRSLFEDAFEYEAFKYFLCKYYSITPTLFATAALGVDDVNRALQESWRGSEPGTRGVASRRDRAPAGSSTRNGRGPTAQLELDG